MSQFLQNAKWNIIKIHQAFEDEDKIANFFAAHQIIPQECKCPECGNLMFLNDFRDGQMWKCRAKISTTKNKAAEFCSGSQAVSMGTASASASTWFSGTQMKLGTVLRMAFMLVYNYDYLHVCNEVPNFGKGEKSLETTMTTARNWMRFVRQVMENWELSSSEKIGGPSIVVEIGASKFGKRRYRSSQDQQHQIAVEDHPLFGGIERQSGKLFLVPVEQCDARTLGQIIQQWVRPGSLVLSDCWKGIVDKDRDRDREIDNLTVHHSIEFVDSTTTTQQCAAPSNSNNGLLESRKKHAHRFMLGYNYLKMAHGCPGYLAHYMFLKWCSVKNVDPFEKWLELVKEIQFEADVEELGEVDQSDDSD